jgi:hypothetical protein
MYDRQILVDYYNGKRSADDPEVKTEFRLLKQQAEIDWKDMYAAKNTSVTAESIEEDYIYNDQLTAKTQRKLKVISRIVGLAILAILVVVYLLQK